MLRAVAAALVTLLSVSAGCGAPTDRPLTISGSSLGAEGRLLQRQLARFSAEHAGAPVELRATPDASDQRHQLFVQWLNANADTPDVLQIDIIWTPEFAAAGWILPLDRFGPPVGDFLPATVTANRWNDQLFALPWFVDVGMLYWRTDLLAHAPETLTDLRAQAEHRPDTVRYGLVWQGARYEGLVTVFLEFLGAFGGRVLDEHGRVVVDSAAAIDALDFMRDSVQGADAFVPRAALAWQEEQTRFAFQNGDALLMRNWPYAAPLLRDAAQSRVAGRFAVASMPAGPGGVQTAALGGSQLAINAHSTRPEHAYELIAFLTAPEQMLERATEVGQYPARAALYRGPDLGEALGLPAEDVRQIVEHAVARPVTPVYAQLSEMLQVRLHRVLTGQQEPRPALEEAAREMRALLEQVGLAP